MDRVVLLCFYIGFLSGCRAYYSQSLIEDTFEHSSSGFSQSTREVYSRPGLPSYTMESPAWLDCSKFRATLGVVEDVKLGLTL